MAERTRLRKKEGTVGGLTKGGQACAAAGPDSAGQGAEAEGGGRNPDSPVPKTAGDDGTGSHTADAGPPQHPQASAPSTEAGQVPAADPDNM